jgi:hypothetical protein
MPPSSRRTSAAPRTASSRRTSSAARERAGFALVKPITPGGDDLAGALAREHRRLMNARRAPVDFSRSTAARLPGRVRAALGDLWRGIAEAEHRSAGIFATYVLDLMGAGAPRPVLSVACRATLDEVRHAELAARLAAVYSGTEGEPALPAEVPYVPDDAALSIFAQSVRQAVFLSVGAETFSAVTLAESLARARDPVVRDVLAVILGDEVHHARLGWAYLRGLLASERADETRAVLREHTLGVFDQLRTSLFGDPRALPPPSLTGRAAALAGGHGYLPVRAQYALFLATVAEVWVPGFAALGLDARPLLRRYPRAPWAAPPSPRAE